MTAACFTVEVAVRKADRQGAGMLLDEWAAEHGYERLLPEVLEPTLLLVGEEWCTAETFTRKDLAAKIRKVLE